MGVTQTTCSDYNATMLEIHNQQTAFKTPMTENVESTLLNNLQAKKEIIRKCRKYFKTRQL